MKDSKKQSNTLNSDLPDDPCEICLVQACCQDPCPILEVYMREVYRLAESDPKHPILDRFPKAFIDGILTYTKIKQKVERKKK